MSQSNHNLASTQVGQRPHSICRTCRGSRSPRLLTALRSTKCLIPRLMYIEVGILGGLERVELYHHHHQYLATQVYIEDRVRTYREQRDKVEAEEGKKNVDDVE